MRSHKPYRARRVRIKWVGAVLSTLLTLLIAFPAAGLATLLLGAAHAADERVPALGWEACYPLLVLAAVVKWVAATEVTERD